MNSLHPLLYPMPCPAIAGVQAECCIAMAGVTSRHDVFLGSKDGRSIVYKDLGACGIDSGDSALKEYFCARLFGLLGIYCPVKDVIRDKDRLYLVEDFIRPDQRFSISTGAGVSRDAIAIAVMDYVIGNSDRRDKHVGIRVTEGKKEIFVIDHHQTFLEGVTGCSSFLFRYVVSGSPSRDAVMDALEAIQTNLSPHRIEGAIKDAKRVGKRLSIRTGTLEYLVGYLYSRLNGAAESPIISGLLSGRGER